ncbi:hypothetical protein DIPPA_70143 [Diplonema papillatum]|nr:hypothetical protein DIPPA_70143 [Diplonema papillatum]
MMRTSRRQLLHASRMVGRFVTGASSPDSSLNLSGLSRPAGDVERRRVLLLRSQKRKMRNAASISIEKLIADPIVHQVVRPTTATDQDDKLARYPNATPAGILRGLDYMGTALFASTGCITAGLAGMDVVGCTLVGTITACGGGTVRDILLGNTPVFWVQEPEYLYLAAGTAFMTFCLWHLVGEDIEQTLMTEKSIFWMDSLGLGAFACIGVQNALRAGLGVLPAVFCGLMTSTFGGVIRDSLCRRPVRILHAHDETYAAAPIGSSVAYLAARSAGANLAQRIACGIAMSLAIRSYAVTNDLKLPSIGYVHARSSACVSPLSANTKTKA